MDIPSMLVLLVVLIMAGAYIALPFLTGDEERGGPRGHMAALRRRAGLLAERRRVYAALRDLDSGYRQGKVGEPEYVVQRKQLVSEGVEILLTIDHLPADYPASMTDPIEAAVLAVRRGEASDAEEPPVRKGRSARKKRR